MGGTTSSESLPDKSAWRLALEQALFDEDLLQQVGGLSKSKNESEQQSAMGKSTNEFLPLGDDGLNYIINQITSLSTSGSEGVFCFLFVLIIIYFAS